MRSWWRLLTRAAVIGACAVTLNACGSSRLSAQSRSAIGETLTRWAEARTPAQACAVMSSGFRFFTGRGNYFDCAADLVQTLGPVTPQTVSVTAMTDQNGQVAVRTRVKGSGPHASKLEHQGAETFWFVWQRGAWRLNSIGERVGLGPPPPGSPGTPPLKRSTPL
jgi:hypothetical protein